MIPSVHLSFIANLAEVVSRFPERTAIEEDGGESVSYAQLWARAWKTAKHLRSSGIQPNETVALLLPRSADYVTSFVGAWLAGAVILPLDPATPRARLEYILTQSKPALLLERNGKPLPGIRSISPPRPGGDETVPAAVPHIDTQCAAYLIYTSGSSGHPKAVLVSHEGLVPVLAAQIEMFQLNESSRCFWIHGLAFDASISDIGTALLCGACLCFASQEQTPGDAESLRDYLNRLRITHVDMPPSLLAYMDPARIPSALRTIIIGGEVCPPPVVRKWASKCRVINVYGPTEATICTSMVVCDKHWTRPLVGDPVPGVKYHIHNAAGELVPHGAAGELWIEGPAVALGYPYEAELTSKRFAFSNARRVYRSGDLVVQHSDGIEFLGRVDRQVKLHGNLICPEEIERALSEHEAVSRAYVFVKETGKRHSLAACLESDGPLNADELRAHIASRLPAWMIPSKWITVTAMPCRPNGKPDGNAIGELAITNSIGGTIDYEPLSGTEAVIADLFRRCLDISHLGRNDDFFQIGGDSLAVVAFLSLAQSQGLDVPADIIYQGRSVAGVAERLAESAASEAVEFVVLNSEVESTWASLTPVDGQASSTVSNGSPSAILLTGATGFLGSALLGELLTSTDCPIICLVRGTEKRARERMETALRKSGFTEEITAMESRCRFVPGDIAKDCFGLTSSNWNKLATEIDTVFHLAADLSLFRPYSNLSATNVGGTRNILEFCLSGPTKRLHYASTLSVFVDADPVIPICLENDLRRGVHQVHGGYAQSKWVAEQLVLKARECKTLATSIYRIGLLTENSITGHAPANDWFTTVLRGATIGEAAKLNREREQLRCDITPVDYAAKAVAWLALRAPCDIYHIGNENSVSLRELQSARQDLESADVVTASGNVSRISSPAPFHRSLNLFKATGTRFDMAKTKAALKDSGIRFPEISPAYLKTIFNQTAL